MGIYTWTDCTDRRKKIPYGGYAKVLLPDGTYIEENSYGGYGRFGGKDVYELVVDWNKPYLEDFISYKKRQKEVTGKRFFGENLVPMVLAYAKNDMDTVNSMVKEISARCGAWFEEDWKRNIGIMLACEDEDNDFLNYPIRITTSRKEVDYSDEGIGNSYSTQ